MPSGLPDNLRPRAQRLYPRTVEGVGVSVNFQSQILRPAAKIIRDDINAAILDEYAIDGTPKVESVKKAMENARRKAMKRLF
jgi:hypothetical protein